MSTSKAYDSREDTIKHIDNVNDKLMKVILLLATEAAEHDKSKLEEPEKSIYDEYTPLLRGVEYGTDEYKEILSKMKVGIDHHYKVNTHHPEYFVDGINGMSLINIIVMLVDWKAAGERHVEKPVDIFRSIDINAERFKIEPQLVLILKNTASSLWYD